MLPMLSSVPGLMFDGLHGLRHVHLANDGRAGVRVEDGVRAGARGCSDERGERGDGDDPGRPHGTSRACPL